MVIWNLHFRRYFTKYLQMTTGCVTPGFVIDKAGPWSCKGSRLPEDPRATTSSGIGCLRPMKRFCFADFNEAVRMNDPVLEGLLPRPSRVIGSW